MESTERNAGASEVMKSRKRWANHSEVVSVSTLGSLWVIQECYHCDLYSGAQGNPYCAVHQKVHRWWTPTPPRRPFLNDSPTRIQKVFHWHNQLGKGDSTTESAPKEDWSNGGFNREQTRTCTKNKTQPISVHGSSSNRYPQWWKVLTTHKDVANFWALPNVPEINGRARCGHLKKRKNQEQFTYLQNLHISARLEERHCSKAVWEHQEDAITCRTNREEWEEETRTASCSNASRVSRNPSGNNREERMDAVSGREDGRHRAD